MDIEAAFPSKWLKHSDLQGQRFTLKIKSVIIEDMQDGEQKAVMYFNKGSKGLVLNKTNATEIANLFGKETDNWAGKDVELYPAKTLYMGKSTDCIRVRAIPAAPASNGPAVVAAMQPAPAAPMGGGGTPFDDDIPFGPCVL